MDLQRKRGRRKGELYKGRSGDSTLVTVRLELHELAAWEEWGEGPALRMFLTGLYLDEVLEGSFEQVDKDKARYRELIEQGWSHEDALRKVTST